MPMKTFMRIGEHMSQVISQDGICRATSLLDSLRKPTFCLQDLIAFYQIDEGLKINAS